MDVLELGNSPAVGHAGRLLAEAGSTVTRWQSELNPLPIDQIPLWNWLNAQKHVEKREIEHILTFRKWQTGLPDVIIDNFSPEFLSEIGINPKKIAKRLNMVWISLHGVPADVEMVPIVPIGSVWMAFRAFALYCELKVGHSIIDHETCLLKMTEQADRLVAL